MTACSNGTVSFTVVLLRSCRITPNAASGSGRSRRTAVLKFYGLRDNLWTTLGPHLNMVNPTRALAMPGWQAVMGWHPEEALALQMAFGVVHPELRSR